MDRKFILTLYLLPLLLFSCQKKETVHIGGSSTVLPVISQVAEVFREQHPEIRLMVNAGGSGVAVNQVGEGKIGIGMISRDLTEEERARFPGTDFVKHVIGRDAVVPVVSRQIFEEGIEALEMDEVRKIYAGEITNWSEVGGPDREILVIDKEHSRGTRHVFMQAIAGHSEADAPGANLVLGANNEVQTAITQSSSAIGMLSYAWLNWDVIGLSIITSGGEIIAPTTANIRSGYFPIIRDIELITNGHPPVISRLFIDMILGEEGQKIVEEAGYVRIDP
jgi:phosphate transport system substrate-binding protein